MEEKKTQEIDKAQSTPRVSEEAVISFTNECLASAATSIFDIAIRWEFGDGMSEENPAMRVAEEMLRQIRMFRRQHYRDLPPAVKNIWNSVSRARLNENEHRK